MWHTGEARGIGTNTFAMLRATMDRRAMLLIALVLALALAPTTHALEDEKPTIEVQLLEDFENDRVVDTGIRFKVIARDQGFRAGIRNIRVFQDGIQVDMKACFLVLKCELEIVFGHNEAGTHRYAFSAEDTGQNVRTKTLSVRYRGLDQGPEFVSSDEYTTEEGQELIFTVAATDFNNDVLTYKIMSMPNGATFNSATQTFRWTPTFTDDGSHTARFEISDGKNTIRKTVRIKVIDKNRDPVFTTFGPDGPIIIDEGVTQTFRMDGNDPDSDDRLEFKWRLDGVIKSRGRTYTYEPDFEDAGDHQIAAEISDGTTTVRKTRTITVRDVNQRPNLPEVENKDVDAGRSVSFTAKAKDEDDRDIITYTVSGMPDGAKFNNKTGRFSWRTTIDDLGQYVVQIKAYDQKGLSDTETVRIRVLKPDDYDEKIEEAEIEAILRRAEEQAREAERQERLREQQTPSAPAGPQQPPVASFTSDPVCNAGYLCYVIALFQR